MSQGAEQQMKRKLLLLMILAPGVFLIIYWASIRGNVPAVDKSVELPEGYVELGQRVELNGEGYRVFQGDKLFSDHVELPNNLVVAEPGRIFLGLGLALDNGMFRGEIKLIDSLGTLYAPLSVKREVVAGNFGFSGESDSLFMFKVNANAQYYFFVVKNDREQAWRFTNTCREKTFG